MSDAAEHWVALVLAAGRGQRIGGPKALIDWNGATLLEAHVAAARACGAGRVYVVVRAAVAEVLANRTEAEWIVSEEAEELGPAGSIRAFATHGGGGENDCLLALSPVDASPLAWRVVPKLATALRDANDSEAARPVNDGRGGHPVLLRWVAFSHEYQRLQPMPLRERLRSAGRTLDVPVDDAAVHVDIDTRDALIAALQQSATHRP